MPYRLPVRAALGALLGVILVTAGNHVPEKRRAAAAGHCCHCLSSASAPAEKVAPLI